MIGLVFVRLLYRVSVQVFGWLASLTRDDDGKTAELMVLRHAGCGAAPPGRYSPTVVARSRGALGDDPGAATPVVAASDHHGSDPVELAPSAGPAPLDLPEPAGTATSQRRGTG